ncbi:MAG: hypothetical protein ACRD82_23495 [Blastocatellia bacterium]
MVICPSCGSSRIRNDYKPAPLILRVTGIRALLCDSCNFQFRAFSPISPKSRRPRHTTRKADVFNSAETVDPDKLNFNPPPTTERREPKLKLPISTKPGHSLQTMPMGVAVATVQPQPRIAVEQVAPVRRDLRTEITKLYAQEAKVESGTKTRGADRAELGFTVLSCPECGSQNIKRRKRNFFERVFLSLTDHKPYVCRKCDNSFYSKSPEQE